MLATRVRLFGMPCGTCGQPATEMIISGDTVATLHTFRAACVMHNTDYRPRRRPIDAVERAA